MPKFAIVLLCLSVSSCSAPNPTIKLFGGNSAGPPEQMWDNLSPEARDLIQRSFKGLEHRSLADVHVHVLGLGKGGTGTYVHPHFESWLHPIRVLCKGHNLLCAEREFGEEFMRGKIEDFIPTPSPTLAGWSVDSTRRGRTRRSSDRRNLLGISSPGA